MAMSKKGYVAGPPTTSYEFFGPLGTFFISISVVYFTYWLTFACNTPGACPHWPWSNFANWNKAAWEASQSLKWWLELWSWDATLVYFGWYLWIVLCWAILPGEWVEGQEMRNGERLKYKMNALATLILTLIIVGGTTLLYSFEPLLFIAKNWPQLMTASFLNSFVQAIVVFGMSYEKDCMLALGGNSPNHFYNWFIGRGLNPRIGSFDIKVVNELRPGLMLWLLANLSFLLYQYDTLGRVTDSLVLVVAFQSWYVIDSLICESAVLSTMDVVSDGFGFMLAVGDLTWVPFTYTTSSRYLTINTVDLGPKGVVGVLLVQLVGYYIFRVSNLEKNNFRKGQNPKNLKYMPTERGTKLLISGWWGLSQHPNYMGDWIMAWAWCLPAGFSHPIPYFYVIYFAILLVHRQARDDHACSIKYGKDWEKYKQLVPYKIIPYVY